MQVSSLIELGSIFEVVITISNPRTGEFNLNEVFTHTPDKEVGEASKTSQDN